MAADHTHTALALCTTAEDVIGLLNEPARERGLSIPELVDRSKSHYLISDATSTQVLGGNHLPTTEWLYIFLGACGLDEDRTIIWLWRGNPLLCRLMTILIIGGSGLLGTELIHQAVAAGHTTAATFAARPRSIAQVTWHALDLRDPEQLETVVAEVAPRLIVNATSGGSDWAVTAEGPIRLAMAAVKDGCRLVHVSSDAVFSGTRVHYDESCLPDPVTPYGAAKAAAETGIGLVASDVVIARTSLIIGDLQSPHVRLVHDLLAGNRNGVLFTDDIRCPVHVADLAAALLELALGEAKGVHHLAGDDAMSRHELGILIARRDGLDASRLPVGLRADSALPGGLDVRLDSHATQDKLHTTLRGARQFLSLSLGA